MNIALSARTQRLLEETLRSGAYDSPDEAVHAALQALQDTDAFALDDETLDALDRAEDQVERGEVHDWEIVRERVRARFLGK
ncbi:MAG TPA: hypothetical protein P5572_16065 [Phycisphaerae bacterium]|nr:hypothetical protein [Phycisphaerae bacterium]